MVVQFTRDGKRDSRSLKPSPTGLKLNTTCRLRRTCMRAAGTITVDHKQVTCCRLLACVGCECTWQTGCLLQHQKRTYLLQEEVVELVSAAVHASLLCPGPDVFEDTGQVAGAQQVGHFIGVDQIGQVFHEGLILDLGITEQKGYLQLDPHASTAHTPGASDVFCTASILATSA